jgi:hypothetical protein
MKIQKPKAISNNNSSLKTSRSSAGLEHPHLFCYSDVWHNNVKSVFWAPFLSTQTQLASSLHHGGSTYGINCHDHHHLLSVALDLQHYRRRIQHPIDITIQMMQFRWFWNLILFEKKGDRTSSICLKLSKARKLTAYHKSIHRPLAWLRPQHIYTKSEDQRTLRFAYILLYRQCWHLDPYQEHCRHCPGVVGSTHHRSQWCQYECYCLYILSL